MTKQIKTLVDIGNDFLNGTSIAQEITATINKQDYIKFNTSMQQRKQATKRQLTE